MGRITAATFNVKRAMQNAKENEKSGKHNIIKRSQ